MTEKDRSEGRLYPPLCSIRNVSLNLAVKVMNSRQTVLHVCSYVIVGGCGFKLRKVNLLFALQIIEYAYEHNVATLHPEPSDKEAYVQSLSYSTDYEEFAVDSYRWPDDTVTVQSCKL